MPNPNVRFNGIVPLNLKESDLVPLDVQSNNSAAVYPGMPVIAQADGSVLRTPAGSAAGAATDGITAVVTEILQHKDATGGFVRTNAKLIPANTVWTAHKDRSRVLAMLANETQRYKVMANAAVADFAAVRALGWANADHVYGTPNAALGLADISLNISTVGTTATRQWRILEFLDVVQNDPTQVNFTAIVIPNLIYALPVVGHSTTAI